MSRKWTWLFLIAVTWYLAGMFRTLPLTVLLLSEIALFVIMMALSIRFRHALDAAFASETAFGEKERDCPCRIRLNASGRLPIGRPRLTLAVSYPAQRGKPAQLYFYGGAEGRRETEVECYVRPPYCGPLEIELREVLTWDYLFLFPAKRRKRERMTMAVLPPPRALNLSFRSTPARRDCGRKPTFPRPWTARPRKRGTCGNTVPAIRRGRFTGSSAPARTGYGFGNMRRKRKPSSRSFWTSPKEPVWARKIGTRSMKSCPR